MSDSRSSRAFFRGARGVRADSSIRIGIAKSVLDEGCSTTRNGREKRLFIGGIRARSEARRVQAKLESGAKGYVAMRLDVTGGTSLVGFSLVWSAGRGAVQDERGRGGCTCIYAAISAPSVENSRDYEFVRG